MPESASAYFPGIHPTLNSLLQQPDGGWKTFHAYHLIDLADALNAILPEPYVARPEDSLQIRAYDEDGDQSRRIQTTADVLISGRVSDTVPGPGTVADDSVLTLPLNVMIADEDDLTGLVIYDTGNRQPITRLEVLSPANKAPGTHHRDYLLKRQAVLQNDIAFVEIDYLHERRPTVARIPVYRDADPGAYPYHILVARPHPSLEDGTVSVYSFSLLDELPVIPVPLRGAEAIRLAMTSVYHRTIQRRPLRQLIDETAEPVNMHRYTESDQAQIRRMLSAMG